MRRSVLFLLVLLATLIASACKSKPRRVGAGDEEEGEGSAANTHASAAPIVAQDAPALEVTPLRDPTKPVVDEDYRFEITWSGEGWRILDEQQARGLSPDALAGATHVGQNLFGVVIAEEIPEVDLSEFTTTLLTTMPLEGKVVEEDVAITFRGMPARRFLVTGMFQGVPFRYCNVVVRRGRFVFQLLAWSAVMTSRPDVAFFAPFVDAVEFMPGEVRGRPYEVPIVDSSAAGARVRGGVFETTVGKYRVRPPKGWRVVVGQELLSMNGEAEVGLVSHDPDAMIVVLGERATGWPKGKLEKTVRAQNIALLGLTPAGGSTTIQFLGSPLAVERMNGGPFVYHYAVIDDGAWCTQIIAWHAKGLAARAEPAILAALGSFERLSDTEVASLRTEIDEVGDGENVVEPQASLRRGVYRNFAAGFGWKRPRGAWRIRAGQQARAANPYANLFVDERHHGVYGLVVAELFAAMTGDQYHAAIVASMQTTAGFTPDGAYRTSTLGGALALTTEGTAPLGDQRLAYRVTTVVRGNLSLRIVTWATPEVLAAEKSVAQDIEAGVFFDLPPAVEVKAGAYIDNRLGYSLELGNAQVHELPVPAMAPIGSAVTLEDGPLSVVGMALCLPDQGRGDVVAIQFIEEIAREKVTGLAGKKATAKLTNVSGQPARHLTFGSGPSRFDLLLVKRDSTSVGVLVSGGDATRPFAGLKLLD